MDSILQSIEDWFRELLVSGIMSNLTNTFDTVNAQVGQIATEVGQTPANFSPAVYNMIRTLSENVIMPIAGLILTFIACYELIQLVIGHNNVVSQAGGLIGGTTAIDGSMLATMQSNLEAMDIGPLLSILLQSFVVQFLMYLLSALIFVIVYARMIEIYLMVSLAPIPFATFGNREQSMIGQNYLRSLFALGFQGFLIMVCVGIYAVLIQSVAFSSDIIGSLWGVMGYTILLAFTLFKTGAVAKSILHAH